MNCWTEKKINTRTQLPRDWCDAKKKKIWLRKIKVNILLGGCRWMVFYYTLFWIFWTFLRCPTKCLTPMPSNNNKCITFECAATDYGGICKQFRVREFHSSVNCPTPNKQTNNCKTNENMLWPLWALMLTTEPINWMKFIDFLCPYTYFLHRHKPKSRVKGSSLGSLYLLNVWLSVVKVWLGNKKKLYRKKKLRNNKPTQSRGLDKLFTSIEKFRVGIHRASEQASKKTIADKQLYWTADHAHA